jgi:outer membrane protein TolC
VINAYSQNKLSLSDAINIGLKNNYDLKIIRKNENVASINNTWGNTGIMPNVDFTLSGRENYNFNDDENYRRQTLSPELRLNWVFFNGFSARITKQKFEELEQQSKGNTVVLVESTVQNIIVAYNNCILQKEMVEVFKKLSELSEDRYSRTRNSEEIGVSTTYESLQAKNSWLEDQSNYLQQKVNYENSIRTLNFILAVEDNMLWDMTTPLEMNNPTYDINDLSGKLMSNNQTLKNQYLYQSLKAKETALAKSDFYPSLSLNSGMSNSDLGNYYSGSTPNMFQNSSDAYVGLSLSLNIFNGGIRKRSVQIAKINEETEQIQTDQLKHSLNNQLLQLFSNYNVKKEILLLADEKVAAAKLNLELSEAKFKNGSINSFNYRDVQNIYMNASIAKFRAVYDLISANADLLRITGGIISEYEEF